MDGDLESATSLTPPDRRATSDENIKESMERTLENTKTQLGTQSNIVMTIFGKPPVS